MQLKQCFLFTIIAGTLLSCNWKETPSVSQDAVAKVYDQQLTVSQFQRLFPEGIPQKDSVDQAKKVINQWALKALLYRNAKINIEDVKAEELNQLGANYLQELYVNHYKMALVKKKLDTLVSEEALRELYAKYQEAFRLKETIVQMRYVLVVDGFKNKAKLKQLLKSSKDDELKELIAIPELKNFYLKDSVWTSVQAVNNFTSMNMTDKDLTSVPRFLEQKTEQGTYVCYIKNRKKINQQAPFDYVESTLKEMVLHKNKLRFFKEMEQTLMDDAIKNKKYEIYR